MEIYESNSHKSKQEKANERVKLEKVVSGSVRTKKKSGVSRFLGKFISTDTPDIKTYIVTDVVVPSIKEAITRTIDMVLYGETRKSRSIGSKVSYRSFYDDKRGDRFDVRRRDEGRVTNIFDDVIVENRREAEDILSRLDDIIDTYGVARVDDLYDLVGITGPYTAAKYGWTNIKNANIVRTREGDFLIEMPKASPIR